MKQRDEILKKIQTRLNLIQEKNAQTNFEIEVGEIERNERILEWASQSKPKR
jgi:hypothetical protein